MKRYDIIEGKHLSVGNQINYREFLPNANFITANFDTAVFQIFPEL